MKHIQTFLMTILVLLTLGGVVLVGKTRAETQHAASSAMLLSLEKQKHDDRADVLKAYLHKYDSPLEDYADVFVAQADKYDLDWRLLAAISGVESTFGKQIPYNSYNGWGWGIYGTNSHSFTSWGDAITTVSKELRERYMDKWGAKNVYQIGSYYAASPTWASRVTYFMEQIDEFENVSKTKSLPLSI